MRTTPGKRRDAVCIAEALLIRYSPRAAPSCWPIQ